jgi:hypothetical protein
MRHQRAALQTRLVPVKHVDGSWPDCHLGETTFFDLESSGVNWLTPLASFVRG